MANGWTSVSDIYTQTVTNGKRREHDFARAAGMGASGSSIAHCWVDCLQTASSNTSAFSFSGTAGAAQVMNSSSTGAIQLTEGNLSPLKRFLMEWQIAIGGGSLASIWLCDFLLYYPSLNINASPTTLDNTNTLTRYTNGFGVECIITTTTTLATTAPTLTFTYTDNNSNSQTQSLSAPATTANQGVLWTQLGTTQLTGPFLPHGSTTAAAHGIKKLDSYTISSGTATGGVCALLLQPLICLGAPSQAAFSEQDYIFNFLNAVEIVDGACLGFIACNNAVITAPQTNYLKTKVKYGWSS